MDSNQQSLNRLVEIINKGYSGAIVVPTNPSADCLAAATSLYLSIAKMGKAISLVSSGEIKSDILASDKFQNTLSATGDNLVISFPYTEGSIDKVDYNIQGESFNLIVTPRQGFPKLDPNQVKYKYTGGIIDYLLILDAPNLNTLGNLYTENQTQFQGKDIINIDRHLTNAFYGTVNLVNKTSSSLSEMALKIIQALNIEFDKDIATNLYTGLVAATNNFTSYSVNANTFDTASYLLKMGAIKKIVRSAPAQVSPPSSTTTQPFRPVTFNQAVRPSNFEKQTPPIDTVEKEKQPVDPQQTPQDWLKPKIMRGGGGLI